MTERKAKAKAKAREEQKQEQEQEQEQRPIQGFSPLRVRKKRERSGRDDGAIPIRKVL
jgi:hypothetical protein